MYQPAADHSQASAPLHQQEPVSEPAPETEQGQVSAQCSEEPEPAEVHTQEAPGPHDCVAAALAPVPASHSLASAEQHSSERPADHCSQDQGRS